jgi:hypothetical protein
MDPDVLNFAQVAVIIVALVGSLALIAVGLLKATTKPTGGSARLEVRNDEQLERLQQSIDVIAIEVERIAEAQRFTAKLMSEKSEPPSLHS